MWCSTLFHRPFTAVAVSYTLILLFLVGPVFLASIHPTPGKAIGGTGESDFMTDFIASMHAPYIFELWPELANTGSLRGRIIRPRKPAPPEFWNLYAAHLALLCTASWLLYQDSCRRISGGSET